MGGKKCAFIHWLYPLKNQSDGQQTVKRATVCMWSFFGLVLLAVILMHTPIHAHGRHIDKHMGVKIQAALDQARRILDSNKQGAILQAADQVPHRWDDKYKLVEWISDTMHANVFLFFARLGLTQAHTAELLAWKAANSSVYLEFNAKQRVQLIEERVREIESDTVQQEKTSSGLLGSTERVTTKVKRKVPEWLWGVEAAFNVSIMRGNSNNPDDRLQLAVRVGKTQLVTTTSAKPAIRATGAVPQGGKVAVDISWLVDSLESNADSGLEWGFAIDRNQSATPRRNPQVEALLLGTSQLSRWVETTQHYLRALLSNQRLDVEAVHGYAPILPLLRAVDPLQTNESCVMGALDTNKLLAEVTARLDEKAAEFKKPGPSGEPLYPRAEEGVLFSVVEAEAVLSCEFVKGALLQHRQALDYVEHMIDQQLVAAIGSEVSAESFNEYTKQHHRELFVTGYSPRPFSLAVRQSDAHSPEGTISIETQSGQPVHTLSSTVRAATPGLAASPGRMSFPLDASTEVR
jgi:hypothetical protein